MDGQDRGPDLDENQPRCPFCGEWNCADPRFVETTISDARKDKEQLRLN